MDSRRPLERADAKPGIVGERRKARNIRRAPRFDQGVFRKACTVLFGFRQREFGSAFNFKTQRREQLFDLAHFAAVMTCNDERGSA
jgi:hypothetical protein